MYRITEVVKHLLIINILMYVGTMLLGDLMGSLGRLQLAMFYPTSPFFEPYQIVTHMFMHGSTMHLFFNMFALFMFGPPLEASWGPKRFLFYYLFTGFGALGLYLLVQSFEIASIADVGTKMAMINTPMLGASGAVFGLLLGYGMLFPNSVIQLLIPPIPLKAKYFVMIYAGIELFLGLGKFSTGVAHFAHLGGALFGFLLILYWRNYGSRL
jgi:membrane associated rhomboid family serine protease